MKFATHLIAAPTGKDDVRYPNGNTKDIIDTVLFADGKAARYTKAFAPTLKGVTLKETCSNIHQFLKQEIKYSLDPMGQQLIKSPGRLWAENRKGKNSYKGGDCKSFSLFTASCLRNLNIPYGYRFVSYNNNPTPTHVYCFVPVKGSKEIIIDGVWDGSFNTQKPYSFKDDRIMIQGAAIGNIDNSITQKKGFLQY
jgi:hypothetical protein